jgi:hypothetical protein
MRQSLETAPVYGKDSVSALDTSVSVGDASRDDFVHLFNEENETGFRR